MTQENLSPPRPDLQDEVTIDGMTFWADREFIPLLRALNEVGLVTRSHCCGHGQGEAWLVIRSGNITGIEIRRNEPYDEIVIRWKPKT